MDVLMPQLGETVAEGTISAWYKAAGDRIEKGENLFEIETDKVSMEVQATESGVLSEIRVSEGTVAPVGAVVAVIGDSVAAAKSPEPGKAEPKAVAPSQPARSPEPVAVNRPSGSVVMDPFREVATPERNFGPANGPLGLKVTPLARRLASQNSIDLGRVADAVSKRGGRRIHKADINVFLQDAPSKDIAAPASPGGATADARPAVARAGEGDTVVPFNRIRKQTATHLSRSWSSAPHVFQAVEVDFSKVDKVRKAQRDSFRERNGISLTYLPFIARAVALAMQDFPRINAHIDGDSLVLRRDINIGFAVDLGHEGLVVPVVRRADGLTVKGLARAIDAMAVKAREGRLEPGDLEGGSYSISNNGSFGTLFTAPIINGPQVAILSTDAVRKRPVVVETEDGDVIVSRPMGMVAQSFDHRAMDGAYSASFLARVKDILETRDWSGEVA